MGLEQKLAEENENHHHLHADRKGCPEHRGRIKGKINHQLSDTDGKRLQLPRHLVADECINNKNDNDDEERQPGDAPQAFHDKDDDDHPDYQHFVCLVADSNQ